jgi:hypothetical protein
MIMITPNFFKEALGSQFTKGNKMFLQVFGQLLYLFNTKYLNPSSKVKYQRNFAFQ